MDTERVSSIFFNNKCLHNFRLGIQTIIFNPKDQQILSVKPYASQKIYSDSFRGIDCNIRDKKEDLIRFAELFYGLDIPKNTYQEYKNLSDLQIAELMTKNAIAAESYTKIYKLEDGDGGFEDGSRISIFKQIFEDILELDLSSTKQTNFYVGIDDVVLSELSVNQMSGQKNLKENHDFSDLFGFKESLYKVWAGQQFSKWFSANFDYPLVPYVKGKALGRDIAIKFADTGELLNLRLPSLDFGFVIKVKGFKKVKLDESDLREAYAWAAFTDIEFHNVGIEKITSVSLKNVLTEEVNKKDDVDDWSNFNLSFNRILKDYSDNLNSFDKKWLSKASKMKSKDFKKHSAIIKDNIGIKKNNKLLKATLITIFIAPSLLAQTISEKGIATVELTGRACSGGSPTDKKVQLKAVEMAKLSAWNKYTSQLSGERSSAYLKSEDSFLKELDKYITDYVILTSNCSKTDKSYSLTIRANINEARVNNKLVTQSGDSQAKANLQGQGIVVLVVPRQTTEALSFDAKITN